MDQGKQECWFVQEDEDGVERLILAGELLASRAREAAELAVSQQEQRQCEFPVARGEDTKKVVVREMLEHGERETWKRFMVSGETLPNYIAEALA